MLRVVLILLFLAGAAGLVRAQPEQVVYTLLVPGGEDGRPDVHAVLQDRQGFLWFGARTGLYRYDGYAFTPYRHRDDDTTSLAHDNVLALLEDRHGDVWVGTAAGLDLLDPETERFYHTSLGTTAGAPVILSMLEDRVGSLWVGTLGDGLYRREAATGTFTRYPVDPRVEDANTVTVLYQDSTGLLWVGTREGLYRYDPAGERFTRYHRLPGDTTSLPSNVVTALSEDRAGRLWVGTLDGGLSRYERRRDQFENHPLDPALSASRAVVSIHEDAAGLLWLGTRKDLLRFDPVTARYRALPLTPPDASPGTVYALYEDRSGVLWAGTTQGIGKLVRAPFAHYQRGDEGASGLADSRILSLAEDGGGGVWVGTRTGLERFDRQAGAFARYAPEAGRSTGVSALLPGRAGRLWVGAETGLYAFDRATAAFDGFFPIPDETDRRGAQAVLALCEAPDGSLLVGTGRGLYAFDPATGTFNRLSFGLPILQNVDRARVSALLTRRDGTLWIGTYNGLVAADPVAGKATVYRHDPADPQSLRDDVVLALHEDAAGRLWVGTRSGLSRLDPDTADTFVSYTPETTALPHATVYSLMTDDGGALWLGTGNGLARFDPATEAMTVYGKADGVQGKVFSRGAALAGTDGTLYFGGTNGLNAFQPAGIRVQTEPAPVVLTAFQVTGRVFTPDRAVSALREIELAHNQNFFAFEFAVLDYRDAAANRYAYVLENFDKGWVESGARRYASYTNVPPGDYVFRVRGAAGGVWNEDGLAVWVVVSPPFWRAPWFYALCLLVGLAGLAYGRAVVHARRLRTRSQELERLVAARTHDLEAEQRKTGEQAERMLEIERSKARFFANVSHDFRTPLTLILGPLQDAMDEAYGPLNDTLRHQLDLMRRSGVHLQTLLNQLLDLSRLEAGRLPLHRQPHDLPGLIRDVVLAFTPLADRRGIRLQQAVDTALQADPVARVDGEKLQQVVQNLLANAFKFTPAQGKILVRGSRDEAGVVIEIQDTGTGIPAEDLPYVFERFYQAGAAAGRGHEGTGLGLALAKEFAELHGGSLTVESEEGFGTTFTVRLPHFEEEASDVAGVQPVALPDVEEDGGWEMEEEWREEEAGDRPCVLVVEDHADLRAYLRLHLARRYEVVEAEDGAAGLALARSHRPALVISDVMMPGMDGYALCEALKSDPDLSATPVILLTAKAAEESELQGLAARADDYIAKPFRMGALLARAENLIEIRAALQQRYSKTIRVAPSEVAVDSADAVFLKRVQEYVEEQMGDSTFGVERLAEEVGLSPRQLQRRMRALTRLSAAGYIRMMRLQRAADLLTQRVGTVSEVAYRVGFRNVDHFSKLFRQTFGSPPSAYPADET